MQKNLIKDQVTASPTPEEEKLLTSLRAASWDEFHGQKKLKETLWISITAAKNGKSHWSTSSSTVLRDSAKRRWPISLAANSE